MPDDRRESARGLLDCALPEVYGYLLARCRDRAVAEDLTSETYVAAASALARGGVDPTVPWLIGIARHKLVDHWRRQARESRHLAAVAAASAREVVDGTFEPGPAQDALSMLNPMQRAALTLRYVDGLPVADVAAGLGRSLHATETLLMRAKAAFRRVYAETEEGDDG